MYPVVLLHLLLLAGRSSESAATVPYDNTGMKFIVVFPENIASYYPSAATNMVEITALHNSTQVTIKEYNRTQETLPMDAGEVKNFSLHAKSELDKQNISSKTLNINSDKNITVQAISLKEDSLQTALIIPTDKLGTTYFIPPIPTIPGTTDPKDLVVRTVTERGPFKIIIVNGDQQKNTVTVTGSKTTVVSLQPGELAQIWLEEGMAFKNVIANNQVAVLFGHPCAIQYNCSCGLLYTILPPAPDTAQNYLIPPFLVTNAEKDTVVLLANKDSPSVKPYDSNSPVYNIAGTVILYRPGLLLPLIPEANFGSCFVVSTIPGIPNNYAVIVVNKSVADGVHVGNNPISQPNWKDLKGTDYCSTQILLPLGKTVIWHSSSKMAVYFGGSNGTTLFGNPASVISSSPDFRGCPVIPEVVQVGDTTNGWRESLTYCNSKQLDLVSMSNKTFQRQVYDKLGQIASSGNNKRKVWIGMRRRSVNGEWYWVNGDTVTDTNWDKGEPGGMEDGQCAIMSLTKDGDFSWSDDDCCKNAYPICYKNPTLLPT